MNKEGQAWEISTLGLIAVFLILIFLAIGLEKITVSEIKINISEGKIVNLSLKEVSVTRITSWGQNTAKGYYDLAIILDDQNEKYYEKIGSGVNTLYFKKFVKCVNVTLSDSSIKEILDNKEKCKNDKRR